MQTAGRVCDCIRLSGAHHQNHLLTSGNHNFISSISNECCWVQVRTSAHPWQITNGKVVPILQYFQTSFRKCKKTSHIHICQKHTKRSSQNHILPYYYFYSSNVYQIVMNNYTRLQQLILNMYPIALDTYADVHRSCPIVRICMICIATMQHLIRLDLIYNPHGSHAGTISDITGYVCHYLLCLYLLGAESLLYALDWRWALHMHCHFSPLVRPHSCQPRIREHLSQHG